MTYGSRLAVFLAVALPLAAQAPRIGFIDFFGLKKVSEANLRRALRAREGDPLPPSKGDAEERLNQVPGVIESHLEAVCCEDGKMILYVGIEERGAGHFELRDAPESEILLPEEITSTYRRLMEAIELAARRGITAEDLTHGHALLADPSARAIQEMLPALARDYVTILREVLRNSSDESQRAAATYVIAYAPRKAEILNDLQYALRDPDPGVRSNAAAGLAALAVLGRLEPGQGLRIQPTWFIEMLNSLSWSDRNRALRALQILTDSRDPSVLGQVRDRALAPLVEMAQWKSLSHALPAFVLVGRVAGVSEDEIQQAWSRGDRESVIAAATGKKAR